MLDGREHKTLWTCGHQNRLAPPRSRNAILPPLASNRSRPETLNKKLIVRSANAHYLSGGYRWDRQMNAQRNIPLIVAVIVAVVGQTAVLFNDFGPGNYSQGGGNGMITSATVSRAGAIAIPSEPTAGRPVS
jgi:hypothetical protein